MALDERSLIQQQVGVNKPLPLNDFTNAHVETPLEHGARRCARVKFAPLSTRINRFRKFVQKRRVEPCAGVFPTDMLRIKAHDIGLNP